MRIVLATPLYPPDIAEPAPYVKELAKRLVAETYEVTIVTYGRLPEQIPGVKIIAIDGHRKLLTRLVLYTHALWHAARATDVVYAENGSSVELPLVIVRLITHPRVVVHIGDRAAHTYAAKHLHRRIIEKLAFACARTVISESPLPRPEILPLEPRPEAAITAYQQSWDMHLRLLKKTFVYV